MADNLDPEEIRRAVTEGVVAAQTLGKQMNDLEKAAKLLEEQEKAAAKTLKEFTNYLGSLGSTVVSTEKGTGKYASAVSGAADTVGDAASGLLKNFGLLGMAVGGIIKIFGGLAAASLKQNDALLKTYKSLSDFGDIDSSGIESLNQKLLGIGATAETSEHMISVLKQVAPELAAFGGTVRQGSTALLDVNKTLLNSGNYERMLTNLGYTTEDILKYSASFIATNTRNQTLLDKNTGNLAAKSYEYMKNLTELSILTGASRDQQEEAMKAQQVELGWRLHIAEVAARGPDGEREAQRLEQGMNMMLLTNKANAKTVMEQIVNSGGIVTAESAMRQNIVGNTYKQLQQAAKGQGDIIAQTGAMLQAQVPAIDKHIANFGATGKISADAARELALDVELLNSRTKQAGMTPEAIAELRKQIDAVTNSTDGRLNSETDMNKSSRALRGTQQDLMYQIGNVAVPAISKFTEGLNFMGAGLAKFTKTITLGKVDFTDMFKNFGTMADVTETLNEEQKKQATLAAERTDLEKKLNESLDRKANAEKKGDKSSASTHQKDVEEYQRRLAINRTETSKSKAVETGAQSAGTAMSGSAVTLGKGALEGLNIKAGANAEDSKASPNLISLAQKLSQIPGFNRITAIDDEYHRNAKDKLGNPTNSLHKHGRAIDFTLLGGKPSVKDGQEIVRMLKELGATNAIDEYNNPSNNSTGGHIHAEVGAMTGARFKGPKTGYPVTLHGNETVFNDKQMNAINNALTKTPIGTGGASSTPTSFGSLESLMAAMVDKLDTLIDYQRTTLFVQEDILTHQKA